jgi:hypothetical protein
MMKTQQCIPLDGIEPVTIDGRIDLAGTRAPVSVTIQREAITGKDRRISNGRLLRVAAAYPLEEGESIEILTDSYSQADAWIVRTGESSREIVVSEDAVPGVGGDRYLRLECDIGLYTECSSLNRATDDRAVLKHCLALRELKRLAAAGPTIDEQGTIRIPKGAARAGDTPYDLSYEFEFRPRLFAWDEVANGGYPDLGGRFTFASLTAKHPEVAHLAHAFFAALPEKQKARILAREMAA